ncbi:MAG TPA: YqhA family protein [Ktedonobacteraceae bacterium]|jgi:uncharacterized membrane protein YqhA|nr:YqhA family protein [Ktedonobacteraceae bacterium]
MLRRALAGSRYLVIIAVIGTFLAAIAVLVYGAFTVVATIIDVFTHGGFTTTGAKLLAVDDIELIDLFLLGTVLYIIALGLYNLFIDDKLPVPRWLEIVNLDGLKETLLRVIIVLLAVTFLGYVVNWDGNANILDLGVAVGLVLFALAFVLNRGSLGGGLRKLSDKNESPKEP